MAWLVLSEAYDEVAAWTASGLRERGLAPLEHVTNAELDDAVWDHRVGTAGARTVVRLADGRELDSADTAAVLNRLVSPPGMGSLATLPEHDRLYVMQERYALGLSWLHGAGRLVLNPPEPRGLAGGARHPAEWAVLAQRAGMRVRATAERTRDVIVLAGRVLASDTLDPAAAAACRRLGELARTPLLGLRLAADGPPALAGATPLPDLRVGGAPVLDALAEALA